MQRNVNEEELAAFMRRALRDFALACTVSLPLHVTLHAAVPSPQGAAAARHVRCSELIGGRVSSAPDADGKRADLGTAHDFLVDGVKGRVTHVIVRSGGLAGIGDTLRCFDMAALSVELTPDAKPTLALATNARVFAAAPSIGARDLDPFRAEIIATQGHGDGEPPERFVPRAPILLLSELSELEASDAHGDQRLGAVHDAWLELGGRSVAYLSLRSVEREVPLPWTRCSIAAFPRARTLQLRIDLGDSSLETAPALAASGSDTLDEEPFRREVAAHFSARLAHGAPQRARS